MWHGWAESFRQLLEHDDARIREAGKTGVSIAEGMKSKAEERERLEDIHGLDL